MFCDKCGNPLPDGAKFCPKCGRGSNAAASKPTSQAAQPAQPAQQQPARQPGQPHYASKSHGAAQQQVPGAVRRSPTPHTASSQKPKKKGHGGAIIAVCAIVVVVALAIIIPNVIMRGASDLIEFVSNPSTDLISGWLQSPTEPESEPQSQPTTTTTTTPTTTTSSSGDTWTVLMYLCGSDLESYAGYATYDLMEIQEADISPDVNMVIEAGGTASWQNYVFEAGYLNRSVCHDGRFDIIENAKMAPMGSTSTFADFIQWGVKNYPADHYMLLFWDHGGGTLYGVCSDEMYYGDMLTIAEMRDGLEASGVHFDVVGFDTCLMGTYETAAALAPYADYMIASEEIISGAGWEYTSWITWLSNNTGCTGAELGEEVCDTYMNACRRYGLDDTATLSCVDLSKIDALTRAFDQSAADLAVATTDNYSLQTLAQAAKNAESYGENEYNMIDLYDFIDKASSVQTAGHADTLKSALNDAVVYNVHGKNRAGAHGLSVFYPVNVSKSEFDEFKDVATSMSYLQMAAAIAGFYNDYDWPTTTPIVEESAEPITEEEVGIKYSQTITNDGYLRLQITDGLENVASVEFELCLMLGTPDDFQLIYLGSDNNIQADWDNGVFIDNFYGAWLTIDDNYVCAEIMDSRDGYNLYAVPVVLNGTEMWLRLSYDFKTNTYTVLDACETMDPQTGAASKTRPIQNGDQITFQFVVSTSSNNVAEYMELGSVVWHDGVSVVDADLGDGLFVYNYRITDVFGVEERTDMVIMDYKGGKIVVETIEDWMNEQL